MIAFEDIDNRLEAIGKDRAWLVSETGRSAGAIRSALAPKAAQSHRSSLIQKALSDAIEGEESRQRSQELAPFPPLKDRITIECEPEERRDWQEAASQTHRGNLDRWMVDALNQAARVGSADQFTDSSNMIPFRTVPLIRAAAGIPILADAEHIEPDRDLGEGRFLLELRGDSMEPVFQSRQRVVLRDKATLKRPALKYGEFYCFIHDGAATFKQWAKDEEGNKVLRSLNPEYADIPADEETDWIGWFDPKDNTPEAP